MVFGSQLYDGAGDPCRTCTLLTGRWCNGTGDITHPELECFKRGYNLSVPGFDLIGVYDADCG